MTEYGDLFMDKLEMPLEQFVQAVVKENERLRDILKINTEQQAEHIKSLLESWEAKRNTLTKEIERLRAALELYRDAVRIDATMEGPKFMGANSSALKRAWDADRAALEGK